MNIKNLFKNLSYKIGQAQQSAKKYTDEKQKTGTFNIMCPRLSNQSIPFTYTQFGDRFLVAVAHVTANTSTDTGRLYLWLDPSSPSNPPFTVHYGFGCASCNDVEYPINSSYSNSNIWLGGLRGNVASGKKLDISLILVGGVILNLLNALSERGCFA